MAVFLSFTVTTGFALGGTTVITATILYAATPEQLGCSIGSDQQGAGKAGSGEAAPGGAGLDDAIQGMQSRRWRRSVSRAVVVAAVVTLLLLGLGLLLGREGSLL